MDNAAILKAGANHAEWDLAIAQLVASGYESTAAEEWLAARLWALTRVSDALYSSLTTNIIEHGLFGQIQLHISFRYGATAVDGRGFVHSCMVRRNSRVNPILLIVRDAETSRVEVVALDTHGKHLSCR